MLGRTSSTFKPFFLVLAISIIISFSSLSSADSFTSTPVTSVHPLETYNYTVTLEAHWGNLTMTSTADWLVLSGDSVRGIPTEDDIGSYLVNLTSTNDTQVAYSNYTLDVLPYSYPSSSFLVLALVFGFGLIGLGLIDHRWFFFAGITWIYLSLAVFGVFGIPWMLIGFIFGFILLLDGAMEVVEQKGG